MKKTKFLIIIFAVIAAVASVFGLCACSGCFGISSGNAELDAVFAKYKDSSKWNFATKVTVTGSNGSYTDSYEYFDDNILYSFTENNRTYTEYLAYDRASDKFTYYCDNGNGTYKLYAENTEDFNESVSYMNLVYLSHIGRYKFETAADGYMAKLPNDAGNTVLGEYEDSVWTSFTLNVENGYIAKIIAVTSDGYIFRYEFGRYGEINFTLPDVSGGTTTPPTEPTGTMEKQIYNAATFDKETLQDKITKTGDEPDPYIGLPSTGKYNALVIPVQFSGDTITQEQLKNLNIAFNGTSEQTGWESVKTYYQKASYGKLDLSFDIQPVYKTRYNYSYYDSPRFKDEYNSKNGNEVILKEVLAGLDPSFDFSPYDWNKDGAIDAVYLIYSAPVVYASDTNDDSIYWAYVTWDYNETTYDGKDAFYYLFAGLDFMNESVLGKNTNENYPVIPGLKVNAATYIHETGHLLGLDDYYDYMQNTGSDEGLGGADMMDATVGDQNVYSKTMLGWLTPQIVTSTKTITIQSSQAKGDAILVPLSFNNSYFCEYLLIDLYSAQGLNELHASVTDSYLYDGAEYGVRIYHVSSSINSPYHNDGYGSFTDNNNSASDIPLIKLIEADGENKFESSNGYAMQTDLWQAGDKLSSVFPKYTRNDGKLLIFDISVDSVSASSATITITYTA